MCFSSLATMKTSGRDTYFNNFEKKHLHMIGWSITKFYIQLSAVFEGKKTKLLL